MRTREICFKEASSLTLEEHLFLLCQIIDAATESETPETEQTAVA